MIRSGHTFNICGDFFFASHFVLFFFALKPVVVGIFVSFAFLLFRLCEYANVTHNIRHNLMWLFVVHVSRMCVCVCVKVRDIHTHSLIQCWRVCKSINGRAAVFERCIFLIA